MNILPRVNIYEITLHCSVGIGGAIGSVERDYLEKALEKISAGEALEDLIMAFKFESRYFGIYYFYARFSNLINETQRDEFEHELIETVIRLFCTHQLQSESKSIEEIIEVIKNNYFNVRLPQRLIEYRSCGDVESVKTKLKGNLLVKFENRDLSTAGDVIDEYISLLLKEFDEFIESTSKYKTLEKHWIENTVV